MVVCHLRIFLRLGVACFVCCFDRLGYLEARLYWSFLANSSIKVVCSSRIITLLRKEVSEPFGHYKGRVGLVI